MGRVLIVVVGIAVMTFSAKAQEPAQNGKDLIEACRVIAEGKVPTADNGFQAGICLGEIDALNWTAPAMLNSSLRACIPTSVTRQQMVKAVVAYLDQNTDQLREPFGGLALEALASTWPCLVERGWFERLLTRIGLAN
jgi:hypothetical protein